MTARSTPGNEADELPFSFLLQGLDVETLVPQTVHSYKFSVAYLSSIHVKRAYRFVLRLPGLVPPRFLELLMARDPLTLTIVGYFFMLLNKLYDHRWLRGVAGREFRLVMSSLP